MRPAENPQAHNDCYDSLQRHLDMVSQIAIDVSMANQNELWVKAQQRHNVLSPAASLPDRSRTRMIHSIALVCIARLVVFQTVALQCLQPLHPSWIHVSSSLYCLAPRLLLWKTVHLGVLVRKKGAKV